jgi:hypothetical protein
VFFTGYYCGAKIENEKCRSVMRGRGRMTYEITVGRGNLKVLGVDREVINKMDLKAILFMGVG